MERTLMRPTQLGFLVVFAIWQPARIDTVESKAAIMAIVCVTVYRNGFYFNVLHSRNVLFFVKNGFYKKESIAEHFNLLVSAKRVNNFFVT